MAVVYFSLGVVLGVVMGATHDFKLAALHAHVNLLGWVSMALIGLLHRTYGTNMNPGLARMQFWLYQAALPVMLIALALVLLGHTDAEPVLGMASMAVGGAVLLLAFNVLRALPADEPGLASTVTKTGGQ